MFVSSRISRLISGLTEIEVMRRELRQNILNEINTDQDDTINIEQANAIQDFDDMPDEHLCDIAETEII